ELGVARFACRVHAKPGYPVATAHRLRDRRATIDRQVELHVLRLAHQIVPFVENEGHTDYALALPHGNSRRVGKKAQAGRSGCQHVKASALAGTSAAQNGQITPGVADFLRLNLDFLAHLNLPLGPGSRSYEIESCAAAARGRNSERRARVNGGGHLQVLGGERQGSYPAKRKAGCRQKSLHRIIPRSYDCWRI